MKILTLSCWSNSIHFRLFNKDDFALIVLGSVERVGMGDSYLICIQPGQQKSTLHVDYCDHSSALALILDALTDVQQGVMASGQEIAAVGHRVAHGGEDFHNSVIIDEKTFSAIRSLRRLAPLHNTYNIAGIEAAREQLPDIPQIAVFDTAFHQTIPEHAFIYPLPYEWYENHAVRRYGFHGHAHLYLSRRAAALLGKEPAECNLVTIYLDRGVSLCAIRNGISIDTSMGMTPLEGAVMDTRCGDIDPGIITFEMKRGNLSAHELNLILNQKSGMFGITGKHYDRGQLVQEASDGNERCALALKIEAYRLKKYIGSYCAAVGPLDGVVFSYGSGCDDGLMRQLTLEGLDVFGLKLDLVKNRAPASCDREASISTADSTVGIFVIPSDEQLAFAEDVASILNNGCIDHVRHAYTFSRSGFVPNICSEEQELPE
ncbi:MAG: acetate kinase [Steroidobacteraceae bacterium]|nr:acetate kinase [Deltaproteobacteria bacterium]